jgi:hypothetical protein
MSSQKQFGFVTGGKGSKHSSCHDTHPILKMGGGEVVGASCFSPRAGFDIYLALDSHGAEMGSDPWDKKVVTGVVFNIRDRNAPSDVTRFKKMITWLALQLVAGKRIHMGCFGGHGRTGTVLAALYAEINPGDKNAIEWVREHHCKKAVESKDQVSFLVKNYGQNKAEPSDHGHSFMSGGKDKDFSINESKFAAESEASFWAKYGDGKAPTKTMAVAPKIRLAPTSVTVNPLKGSLKSIWAGK